MVYALWLTIIVALATGLMMTGGATPMEIGRQNAAVMNQDWSTLVSEGEGDEDREGEDDSGLVEELHEAASNLLLLLAALHLAGVLVESAALRRNIVRPMIVGKAGRQ